MKVSRVPYGTQGALVTFFFNAISQFFLKNRLNIFCLLSHGTYDNRSSPVLYFPAVQSVIVSGLLPMAVFD